MKIVIIIQARMASTRLPKKTLKDLAGKPILQHVVDRCKESIADEVVVATSTNEENGIIEEFCKWEGYNVFRGSEDDVLERFYMAAKKYSADIVIRATADDPLMNPAMINDLINLFKEGGYDYVSNVLERTWPRGLDTEVFSFEALEKAHELAKDGPHREHVTAFIYAHPEMFKLKNYPAKGILRRPDIRLAIDTPKDFAVLSNIFENLSEAELDSIEKIIEYLDKNPEIRDLNSEDEKAHRAKHLQEGINQKII